MDYRFEHEKLAQSFFSENSVRESAADTSVEDEYEDENDGGETETR